MKRSIRAAPPLDAATKRTLMAAIDSVGAGRLDEAARALEAGGGSALRHPVGRNVMGDIHLRQGRARDALKAFDAAIRLAPQLPEAHCNRAVALQEMGRLAEALVAVDRALSYRHDYPTAHYNRGNVLKALGRRDEAIEAYGQALKSQPNFPEALLNRGMALVDSNKPMAALEDFRRALAARPGYAAAHIGMAGAYRDLGRTDAALAAIGAARAIDPDGRDADLVEGGVLSKAERFDEALAVADRLIERDPASTEAHAVRALALWNLERLEEALAEADEAVRLAPDGVQGHTARGIVLGEMERLQESLDELRLAGRFGATGHAFQHSLALALNAFGNLDEARTAFEHAIALAPDSPTTRYHYSFFQLSLGEFEEGWEGHEWRLKMPASRKTPGRPDLRRLAPQWRGEDVAGRKVLIYNEQGHGDSIQFLRYVPLLAARGARISLLVPEALRRLVAASLPDIDVADALGMRAGFDYQSSLMSLPFAFRTRLESVPADVPYLRADADRVRQWRQRLGEGGFRVGVIWQGNPQYGRDRERSIRLAHYAPLAAVAGVRLISLQAQHGLEQLDDLPAGMEIERLGERIVNNPDGFRDMAAAMMNMDLMITSDTGPAHLAGALGRPTWVALRTRPDWRWMLDRADSPWYPTMRLFRQPTPGDWPGLFAEIAEALREAVAAA
jgi:tetratricopeptide (TPR) repeat protein